MSKEVTVYWACLNEEWLRAKPPVNIYREFIKNNQSIRDIALNMCPGFKDYSNNHFGISSLYDYSFQIENGGIKSTDYNKAFFDKMIYVRSLNDKIFSFNQYVIFFTEEKSLELSCGINPFLEDNNITKRCITIPGTVDIGKWFRAIDFAFILKNGINDFKIEEGEIFQYIKLHTDKKIKFQQFIMTDKLTFYKDIVVRAKDNRKPKARDLAQYYSMFNLKNNIMKEIKSNLIQ